MKNIFIKSLYIYKNYYFLLKNKFNNNIKFLNFIFYYKLKMPNIYI